MTNRRRFSLFVRGHWSPRPERAIVPTRTRIEDNPVSLLPGSSNYRISPSRLPNFGGICFAFPKVSTGEVIQNFYHMDDFMIVSQDIKEVFAARFGRELEVSSVHIQHGDGSPSQQMYFAVRVKTVIDCIDRDRSTWKAKFGEQVERRFTDGLSVSLLDENCRGEYANGGGSKYISYPSFYDAIVGNVQLIEDRIPPHAVLFQPKYWPGHWIIESSFADTLERACAGGTPGYYFWGLCLNDVEASHRKYIFDLR